MLLVSDLLQERNQIRALLRLLDARKHHLRAWDVLLRIQQVIEQGLLAPHDPRVLVRRCVREPFHRSALTPEQPVQVRALLRRSSRVICDVAGSPC